MLLWRERRQMDERRMRRDGARSRCGRDSGVGIGMLTMVRAVENVEEVDFLMKAFSPSKSEDRESWRLEVAGGSVYSWWRD